MKFRFTFLATQSAMPAHIYMYVHSAHKRYIAVKQNTIYNKIHVLIYNNNIMQTREIDSRRQIFIDSVVNVHRGTNPTLEWHSNGGIISLLLLLLLLLVM